MNHIKLFTYIMSDLKDIEDMRFLENLYSLIELMIKELVPPIIEETLRNHRVDIETRLNNQLVNSKSLKEEIINQISEQFRG